MKSSIPEQPDDIHPPKPHEKITLTEEQQKEFLSGLDLAGEIEKQFEERRDVEGAKKIYEKVKDAFFFTGNGNYENAEKGFEKVANEIAEVDRSRKDFFGELFCGCAQIIAGSNDPIKEDALSELIEGFEFLQEDDRELNEDAKKSVLACSSLKENVGVETFQKITEFVEGSFAEVKESAEKEKKLQEEKVQSPEDLNVSQLLNEEGQNPNNLQNLQNSNIDQSNLVAEEANQKERSEEELKKGNGEIDFKELENVFKELAKKGSEGLVVITLIVAFPGLGLIAAGLFLWLTNYLDQEKEAEQEKDDNSSHKIKMARYGDRDSLGAIDSDLNYLNNSKDQLLTSKQTLKDIDANQKEKAENEEVGNEEVKEEEVEKTETTEQQESKKKDENFLDLDRKNLKEVIKNNSEELEDVWKELREIEIDIDDDSQVDNKNYKQKNDQIPNLASKGKNSAVV